MAQFANGEPSIRTEFRKSLHATYISILRLIGSSNLGAGAWVEGRLLLSDSVETS
jgi:hypothetical protein